MKLEFIGKDEWLEKVNPFFSISYFRIRPDAGAPYFTAQARIDGRNEYEGSLLVKFTEGASAILEAKRGINLEISRLLIPEDK